MTIVVASAAPDGIVLASDSRTTRFIKSERYERYRVMSDHTQKLFAPYPGVGIATSGAAFIGTKTINGIVEEWAAKRSPHAATAVDAVAKDLARFVNAQVRDYANRAGRLPANLLGFLVAGYDPGGVGRVREIRLPPEKPRPLVDRLDVDTSGRGMLWRGRTHYVRRLIEGFDRDAFIDGGGKTSADFDKRISNLHYILQAPITLQDALDAAVFVVRLTIDMERITDGKVGTPGAAPSCGGPVQALVISRTRTEWVQQPSLSVTPAGTGSV